MGVTVAPALTLAWEDPRARVRPFWARAAMPEGMVAPDGQPLAALAAAGRTAGAARAVRYEDATFPVRLPARR